MTKEEALQKLEFERKWLSDAGYNAYNVDIAFASIRTIIRVLCGDEPILNKIKDEIQKLRGCSCCCSDGIIDDVEDIIDKYMTESGDE